MYLYAESTRSTSLAIKPYETEDTPGQPYPSIVGPSRPSSPISLMIFRSNVSSRLAIVTRGNNFSWQ